jgi:DNA-binding CsgD family transcriptional regulator
VSNDPGPERGSQASTNPASAAGHPTALIDDTRDGTHGGSVGPSGEAHFGRSVRLIAPVARPTPAEIDMHLPLDTCQIGASGLLLGRQAEMGVIDRLLQAARTGLSGAVVLYGDAGMGKTALLDYAVTSAPELGQLRVSGIEQERGLGFAALQRLLSPLLSKRERLPRPQRDALGSALGLSDRAPADRFLVGLATLTLLSEAATSEGLLCIVDDAQWLDQESLQVLTFVARRLGADSIALVFGIRPFRSIPPEFEGLERWEIGGLPESTALELISRLVSGPLDPSIARRVVEETGGCALAIIELAGELSEHQWSGLQPPSDPLPVSGRLVAHFRRQVDLLSQDERIFALVAASESSGDPSLVRRVARSLGSSADAEMSVVQSGLITADSRIEFRHPLIRAATYASATPKERMATHKALADAIDVVSDPDRHAQHLVACATGSDETLASLLEVGSQRARRRGGYAAESSLLSQSAQLSEDPAIRGSRLLKASVAALTAGSPLRAHRLLDQASADITSHLERAESERLDGLTQLQLGEIPYAVERLHRAARSFISIDTTRARETLLEGFEAWLIAQNFAAPSVGAEMAATALGTSARSEESPISGALLDGTALLLGKRPSMATPKLKNACRIMLHGGASDEEAVRWCDLGMVIAHELYDDRSYHAWVEQVEEASRRQGALIALQIALVGLAVDRVRCGRFAAAEGLHAEVVEITAAMGGMVELYRPLQIHLLAWRGDGEGTRAAARALIDVSSRVGASTAMNMAYMGLAVLEIGDGNYSSALAAVEHLTNREAIGWTCQALPLSVEAAIRCGERDKAMDSLARLSDRARASGTHWALGLLARSNAIAAGEREAEPMFLEALGHLEATLAVTDLGLTYLAYGEWLRRKKRRRDARTHLRRAGEMFSAMGAKSFAERAHRELGATGERARLRTAEFSVDLTPREHQIAELASTGATNPDIAARLFISPNTVDYHLRKVFQKLGLTSRRQLASALMEQGD